MVVIKFLWKTLQPLLVGWLADLLVIEDWLELVWLELQTQNI